MTSYNDVATIQSRLAELERRMGELETSARLSAAGVGEGGLDVHDAGTLTLADGGIMTVKDGGDFRAFDSYATGRDVLDPTVRANAIFKLGDIFNDDSSYSGTGMIGQRATQTFSPNRNDVVEMYSNGLNYHEVLFVDNNHRNDTLLPNIPTFAIYISTVRGLQFPYLNYGYGVVRQNMLSQITNTTWAIAFTGSLFVTHNFIRMAGDMVGSSAGTSAQLRMTVSDPAGGSYQAVGGLASTVGAGGTAWEVGGVVPFPIGSQILVNIEMQNVSGVGSVGAVIRKAQLSPS